MDWETLADAWEMDDGDPRLYVNPRPPMYTTPCESGLSSPAIVNDVVLCSTSKVAVYAFDAYSGKLLWQDQLGEQTGGMNGGYGYCLGPAVAGDYVVAGALVFGKRGGVLRVYSLPESEPK
jgi:outer membrane protein assembly factor BamB